MRSIAIWVLASVFAGGSAACGSRDESTPADAGPATGAAGTGLATGLACDVQTVLENRCLACHDGKREGVPPLLDYADLTAPSITDPSKTRVELAVTRLKSTTSPMPPPPAVPPDREEVEAFETWLILGTPKNPVACTDAPPKESRPREPNGEPIVETVCTSGKMWTAGIAGSPLMNPGLACNACHQVSGGPNLQFAGTVYPTLHEADRCNGANLPGLTVIVTDSKGKETQAAANEAGNFQIQRGAKLFPPFKARVTAGGKTRAMNGTVTSGDCNSCHTVQGLNGAPGRILAPE